MPKAVKARHGQRTIALTVRFWTDKIAPKGKVEPGVCWEYGMVRFPVSKTHGIEDMDWVPFESLSELTAAVQKAAKRAGVRFKPNE